MILAHEKRDRGVPLTGTGWLFISARPIVGPAAWPWSPIACEYILPSMPSASMRSLNDASTSLPAHGTGQQQTKVQEQEQR